MKLLRARQLADLERRAEIAIAERDEFKRLNDQLLAALQIQRALARALAERFETTYALPVLRPPSQFVHLHHAGHARSR